MYVKLLIGKQIVNIVSAYATQVGLSAEEKDDFWDSFIIVLSGIPKQENIFIGSDMNGHVGRDADGYVIPNTMPTQSLYLKCAMYLNSMTYMKLNY